MSSEVGCNSFLMSRPTLHRRKARRCGPADVLLGRSRPTRSHLRQIISAADVVVVNSSEKNSTRSSSGSMPGQPTMLPTYKRGMNETRPDKRRHKWCKRNSMGEA